MKSKQRTAAIVLGSGIALVATFWGGFSSSRLMDGTRNDSESHDAHGGGKSSTRRDDPNASTRKQPTPTSSSKSAEIKDWTKCPLAIADIGLLLHAPMTPELAQILLERVKSETKGIQDRASLSSIILKVLCDRGFSEKAWELLEKNPGAVRNTEIGALFQSDKIPTDALLAKLGAFTDPQERMQAIVSLIGARPKEVINLDSSAIPVLSSQDKIAIASGIMSAMRAQDENRDPALAAALLQKGVDLVKADKLDLDHLLTIVRNDIAVDPFQQWEVLGGLHTAYSAEDSDKIFTEAVSPMIRADLGKAMEILTSDPSSKYSIPILSRAISTMYEADSEQATSWIQGNLANIDPATAQRITFRVGQVAIKNGEFETAQKWANNLVNPDVRQQLLNQIREAQQPAQNQGK